MLKTNKILATIFLVSLFASVGWAQGNPPLVVQEADGSPKRTGISIIEVSNGTLTISGRKATITTGGGGLTVGTTAIASGTAGRILYETSGNLLGEIVGSAVTADGAVTLASQARTSGVAQYFRVNTPADTTLTASTESVGVYIGGDGSGSTVTRQWSTGALTTQREYVFVAPTYAFAGASTLTTAATVAITGPAVAGTGASITNSKALWIQSGPLYLEDGGSASNVALQIAAKDNGLYGSSTSVLVVAAGIALTNWSGSTGDVTFRNDAGILWGASGLASADTGLWRGAAAVVRLGDASTGGGTFAANANSPAQIVADTNNYTAGSSKSYLERWNTDASRNITGLANDQIAGQTHVIFNVGSNNIVLKNEDAASTAANRFLSVTGADITLGANEGALAVYDATTQRWRTFELAAAGSSSLTVGTTAIASGTAGRILYEASGNVLGEAAGITYQTGASPSTTITAQNASYVGLAVISAATPSTDVFQVSADNGTTTHFKVTSTGAPTGEHGGITGVRYGAASSANGAGGYNTAIGYGAVGGYGNSVVIGTLATGNGVTSVIVFGRDATATANNQFVAGSTSSAATNVFFGKGVTDATPTAYTINGTGGSGTDIAGAALNLAGGKGTGTGTGGDVNIQFARAGSTGSSLNTLSTIMAFSATATGTTETMTGPNGGTNVVGVLMESVTLSTGGATTDSTIDLPANSIILSVTGRITTTITTATDWKLGDATIADRFSDANATLTANTTTVGINQWKADRTTAGQGAFQQSTAKVRITTTGTPGAGVIRITIHYITLSAPTS